MPQSYTPEFKKKIVRLHLEEGRTYKSITAEYGVSKASISKWCSEFSEECQAKVHSAVLSGRWCGDQRPLCGPAAGECQSVEFGFITTV